MNRSASAPGLADKVTLKRSKPSSIWEKRLPERRHHRRLSWSQVGLSGQSPTYVQFRGPSPTREQKCKDRIQMTLEMGSIDDLWEIYIESSAWHQDDNKKWPIQNRDLLKVRKAIESGLRRKIKQALESDELDDLEAAAQAASNKVKILAFHGNAVFHELDKVYERIEEKQNAMLGTTRKPSVSQDEKVAAIEAVKVAVDAQDGAELSKAIRRAMEINANVTEFMEHLRLSSKYFAKDRSQGLFEKGCFKGQRRTVHILNLGPELDLNLLERLLQVHGVAMKYYTDSRLLFKSPQDRESRKGMSVAAHLSGKSFGGKPIIMQDPTRHTVWVISGPEPSKLQSDIAMVGKLMDFHREGGGIGIIGSGNRGGNPTPLICDANVLLKAFGLERMWGHSDGKKTLSAQSGPGQAGFNQAHPVSANVSKLHEGFSVTAVADSVLTKGFVELQRGSNGKLLTAIREPSAAYSGEAGPVVLHASPIQLLASKENVGQEQWIANLFLYSCLRAVDMTEDFNGEEAEEQSEADDDEDEVAVVTEDEEEDAY